MANLKTTAIYSLLQKAEWGEGEWLKEADQVTWTDDKTGLFCVIVRSEMGNLCGYVGVSPGAALYGTHYDDGMMREIEVHGGLTFSNELNRLRVPDEGQEYWLFGFDCAHAYDLVPAFAGMGLPNAVGKATYRDVFYVSEQVRQLAEQIARLNAKAMPLGIVNNMIKKIAKKG